MFQSITIVILPSPTQPNKGRQYVTLLHLQNTSGLSMILHGFIHISLPAATSCDKLILNNIFSIRTSEDTCSCVFRNINNRHFYKI